MATIDIKLKSYDELIFEITKLNTDKYLLEQENKQLKERFERLKQEHIDTITRNEEKQQRINKAIEYTKTTLKFARLEKDFEKEKILLNFLEILGDKE